MSYTTACAGRRNNVHRHLQRFQVHEQPSPILDLLMPSATRKCPLEYVTLLGVPRNLEISSAQTMYSGHSG